MEMLVAASVFAALVALATGAFIHSLRNQRLILAVMAVNDNTSLVLEQMAREMRVARDFDVPRGQMRNEIQFTDQNLQKIAYRFEDNAIKRRVGDDPTVPFLPVTSRNVYVDYLDFERTDPSDIEPIRITIAFGVHHTAPGLSEEVVSRIQTTVTVRE